MVLGIILLPPGKVTWIIFNELATLLHSLANYFDIRLMHLQHYRYAYNIIDPRHILQLEGIQFRNSVFQVSLCDTPRNQQPIQQRS